MSEKQAKEKRRQQMNSLAFKIVIDVVKVPNGLVVGNVGGFPANLITAIHLMQQASIVVTNHFAQLVGSNKLDDKLNIKQSNIMTMDKDVILPGMPSPNQN